MSFNDGERTARDYLIKNKDRIKYVILEYIVAERTEVYSGLYGVKADGSRDELYYIIDIERLDEEYSISGYTEEVIEFLDDYCCWDGILEEKGIGDDGLLYCQYTNDISYYDNTITDYNPNEYYLKQIPWGLYAYRKDGIISAHYIGYVAYIPEEVYLERYEKDLPLGEIVKGYTKNSRGPDKQAFSHPIGI